MRVGIIGLGGMGWFHAARYYQVAGAQLAAIADVRPERLEARNAPQINIQNQMTAPDLAGVARFESGDALIAGAQVDMIDICLPSYLHAEYAIKALRSGRHVLSEKPMALSVADAEAMITAARESGRKLMVAQCIRFWPEYQYLRQVLRTGNLGRLLSLNLVRIGGRPTGWGWQDWFMDPARSGGTLYDLHIHDIDYVNALLGVPQRVVSTGRQAQPGSAVEVIQTIFQYAGGPQVSIQAGWSEVQIPFKAGYDAWFEKGFVRYDASAAQPLVVYDDASRQHMVPAEYTPGDAYLNEIRYFVDCIQKDREPLECPPESARDSLALLARVRAAIQSEVQK